MCVGRFLPGDCSAAPGTLPSTKTVIVDSSPWLKGGDAWAVEVGRSSESWALAVRETFF